MEDKEALEVIGHILRKRINRLTRLYKESPNDNLKADTKAELCAMEEVIGWVRIKWSRIPL